MFQYSTLKIGLLDICSENIYYPFINLILVVFSCIFIFLLMSVHIYRFTNS